MEALLILLGEFLFAPFVAVLTVAVEGVISLIAFGVELLGRSLGRQLTKQNETPRSPSKKEYHAFVLPKWFSLLRHIALGSLVLTVLSLLLLQMVFFDNAIRWVASKIEQRTQIEIEFAETSGNLFLGRFQFLELRLNRSGHSESDFDLAAKSLTFDIDIWRVFSGMSYLDELSLSGLQGTFDRKSVSKVRQERRPFVVQSLHLDDSSIILNLPTKAGSFHSTTLKVESLKTEPFRSSQATFDILFRSSIQGSFAGGKLDFSTHQIKDGRETRWLIQELPIQSIAPLLPAPLTWAKGGLLNLHILDYWTLNDDQLDIDMKWNVEILDPQVEVPASLPLGTKAIALPIVGLLNRTPSIPISFELRIDPDTFSGSASPETLSIWSAASELLIQQLSKLTELSPEKLKEVSGASVRKFKEYLEQRRK